MSSNMILPNNFYGVTSFDNLLGQNQKKKNSALDAIYSAGSQATQLTALTTAIGSLRSAAAGASNPETKAALTAKIGDITTAMKNSFNFTASSFTYTAQGTGNIRAAAKENASAMLSKYQSGTGIDELI